DDDSLIAVSVRHEQFVRLRVNEYVGRLPEVLRVRVGLLLTTLTDLHDELAGLGELQDLVIVAVAPDPDKAFRIDINSMLRFRPVITRPRAAPSLDEVAFSIEFQHRRRGLRLLFRAQRVRPLQHPDRKSTRLNSSHGSISYAVFCLIKKKICTIEIMARKTF